MTTPLYSTFSKRIQDSIEQIITKQITPWRFLSSGKPMRVSKFDGKLISYEGIGFEGSPQQVFWHRYIEPFLEDLSVKEITAAVEMAQKRQISGKELLQEVQQLLYSSVSKVYREMAHVEQSLLGRGFPDKVPIRTVDSHIQVMKDFIDVRINDELRMWKDPMPLEVWLRNHPALTKLLVAIALGIVGWLLKGLLL